MAWGCARHLIKIYAKLLAHLTSIANRRPKLQIKNDISVRFYLKFELSCCFKPQNEVVILE